MQDSSKYLIHARITANGVVERSDVVGAIFGQTEGLLGDELEIRELQESSKLGRIDVQIDSERGKSFGDVTIASGLDRVETAILAASLETIDRVGPCRATFEVVDLEDVRQAKRREVIERATGLLEEFDDSVLSSQELIEEVRRRARTERITDYNGYPAGPRVADSDAIIVVEGRSDVLRLLQFGIKNAVAVEGTDVPDAIARLTSERTVTTFLDGDRGGELILKELAQVGNVDYVAFAPPETSVEDLSREAIMTALREKVEFEKLVDGDDPETISIPDDAVVATGSQGSAESTTADGAGATPVASQSDAAPAGADPDAVTDGSTADSAEVTTSSAAADQSEPAANQSETAADQSASATVTDGSATTDSTVDDGDGGGTAGTEDGVTGDSDAASTETPPSLADHIQAVIGDESGLVRLLDEGLEPLEERPAEETFEAIESADSVPTTVVVDGVVDQRVLDVAAQRGVDRVIATDEGEFVKKPTSVALQVS